MCEFCDARLYQYGSAATYKTYSHDIRLCMKHAGRGAWELHVLDMDGELIASFDIYHCPMCGKELFPNERPR